MRGSKWSRASRSPVYEVSSVFVLSMCVVSYRLSRVVGLSLLIGSFAAGPKVNDEEFIFFRIPSVGDAMVQTTHRRRSKSTLSLFKSPPPPTLFFSSSCQDSLTPKKSEESFGLICSRLWALSSEIRQAQFNARASVLRRGLEALHGTNNSNTAIKKSVPLVNQNPQFSLEAMLKHLRPAAVKELAEAGAALRHLAVAGDDDGDDDDGNVGDENHHQEQSQVTVIIGGDATTSASVATLTPLEFELPLDQGRPLEGSVGNRHRRRRLKRRRRSSGPLCVHPKACTLLGMLLEVRVSV